MADENCLDRALLEPSSSLEASGTERPASLSRVTFSESDIRGVISDQSDSKRPSTPNRRRAPKLPSPRKLRKIPRLLPILLRPARSSRRSRYLRCRMRSPAGCRTNSVRLSAFRARSPDITAQSANENAPLHSPDSGLGGDSSSGAVDSTILEEVHPLASSTPDRPKPSHLLSRLKPAERPPDRPVPPSPCPPVPLHAPTRRTPHQRQGKLLGRVWPRGENLETNEYSFFSFRRNPR